MLLLTLSAVFTLDKSQDILSIRETHKVSLGLLTFWRRNFLQNFSTPVFKMWKLQEPKKVAL